MLVFTHQQTVCPQYLYVLAIGNLVRHPARCSLGIHPFDQPDVEASKVATRKLTAAYEKTGALPTETPIFTADGIKLFTAGGRKLRDDTEEALEAELARLEAEGIPGAAARPAGRASCGDPAHAGASRSAGSARAIG